jgi:hypothetical protein
MKTQFVAIDTAISGNTQLVAGIPGCRFQVLSLSLIAAGTVNVKLTDGPGGTELTGPYPLAAQSGLVLPVSACGFNGQPTPYFDTITPGNDLTLNLSGAVQVSGHVSYRLVRD